MKVPTRNVPVVSTEFQTITQKYAETALLAIIALLQALYLNPVQLELTPSKVLLLVPAVQ